MTRPLSRLGLVLVCMLGACEKKQSVAPGPTPEEKAAAEKAAAEKAAAEKAAAEQAAAEKAAAEYANREYFTLATFNLAWAHDDAGSGPKAAAAERAQTAEDWNWKKKAIAEVIAEHKPDVVALHELGGSSELSEIVTAIAVADGPEYDYAIADTDDKKTGHHSAIISRFPIGSGERPDVYLRRLTVVELELPKQRGTATLVAFHAPEGTRGAVEAARLKQFKALLRALKKARAAGPVIYMGTLGSNIVPTDAGYASSSAGMLAGANTPKEADDCDDSSAVGSFSSTTTTNSVADRVFSCGLEMRDASVVGEDKIVRGYNDDWKQPWPAVPIDKDPMRDVSDHLMLLTEIALPKPPPSEEPEKAGEAEAGATE